MIPVNSRKAHTASVQPALPKHAPEEHTGKSADGYPHFLLLLGTQLPGDVLGDPKADVLGRNIEFLESSLMS